MRRKTEVAAPEPSRRTPVADRIKPVAHLPTVFTGAFYGRAGSGKTTISASFPKPMLVIDVSEKGTDSIADVPGVDVIRVKDWTDIEDVYWELTAKGNKYKTVSIDSLHAAQSMAIDSVKVERGAREGEQTTKHDFMRASGLMQTWVMHYRDLEELGINVIFIVHDRLFNGGDEMDTEDGQLQPEVGPRLMPSVNSTLTGSVKLVGHTFIRDKTVKSKKLGVKPKREIEYCLRIGPHGYYTTKVRSPKESVVPDYLVDATYKDIMEVMKGLVPQDGEQKTTIRRRIK